MKYLIIASLAPLLLANCSVMKKKEEVGPFGDKRSRMEKLLSYEEEHYENWHEKWMHRERYKRAKANVGNKKNP